jgi:hypothetical protein
MWPVAEMAAAQDRAGLAQLTRCLLVVRVLALLRNRCG